MANLNSSVMYAQTYEPYGSVLRTTGSVSSRYGFTGEWTDGTGKIYLRARYYATEQARFNTRDIWSGSQENPISYNKWLYAQSNPLRYRDPSGYISEGETTLAEKILDNLYLDYGVRIIKDWGWENLPAQVSGLVPEIGSCPRYWQSGNWRSIEELKDVMEAIKAIAPGKMSMSQFGQVFRHVRIARTKITTLRGEELSAAAPPGILAGIFGDVVLSDYVFNHSHDYAIFTIVHEMGHVWDYQTGNQLSMGMMQALGTWICDKAGGNCRWAPYAARVDEQTLEVVYPEPYPGTPDKCGNGSITLPHPNPICQEPPYGATYGRVPLLTGPGAEDWANSFASYVYPDYYKQRWLLGLKTGGIREGYVQDKINSIH
ncbi:MAG: RHS repeat-associated core domain-containing protein [Phycisphaerae bacterium]|nr:RHS repeat-associated core domain-containing protein [Phycisphaerae bacterium]